MAIFNSFLYVYQRVVDIFSRAMVFNGHKNADKPTPVFHAFSKGSTEFSVGKPSWQGCFNGTYDYTKVGDIGCFAW